MNREIKTEDRHQVAPYPLRLPPEIRVAVQEAAKAQDRSFNSQVVSMLRASLPAAQGVAQ